MSKYSDKELFLYIIGRNCIGFFIVIKFVMCFDIFVWLFLYKVKRMLIVIIYLIIYSGVSF